MPQTIRQVIDRQIDHLDEDERRLLEAASVAGVEFTTLSAAAAMGADAVGVEELCEHLAERNEFLNCSGVAELPDGKVAARYRFIHSLYQNVLYERVTASRRVQFHHRVGKFLESAHQHTAGEIAAELAMHFERGRDLPSAVKYLHEAGDKAAQRFANREAALISQHALDLLSSLPASIERDRTELMLQTMLGASLIAVHGFTAPQVGKTYNRALELCDRVGKRADQFRVLWGIWVFHVVGEGLNEALQVSERLLELVKEQQDPTLVALAHWTKEATLVNLGDFAGAREHFERILESYDYRAHSDQVDIYWHEPAVASRCFGAWALWCLGFPDTAVKRLDEAIAIARELFAREVGHPQTVAVALFFTAFVRQFRLEPREVLEATVELLALSRQHGFIQWIAFGTIFHGWAMAKLGDLAGGIKTLREGLGTAQTMGSNISRPHFLALLADILADSGELAEARSVVDEALSVAGASGDRYYESELCRMKGELLLGEKTDPASKSSESATTLDSAVDETLATESERLFRLAVDIARSQGALSFQLRATVSLNRFLVRRRNSLEASQMLAGVCSAFTEGSDTVDLRVACQNRGRE